MKKICLLLLVFPFVLLPQKVTGQVNPNKFGAWYMYFFSGSFKDSTALGFQGDVQYRNWDLGGDLEQLLIRGGITYTPKQANIKFTLGYGNITTGAYGVDIATTSESRIYQEALFPVRFGNRFYTNHRFRFEQRFVENQDFRSRYRYNLFLNIPLNKQEMMAKTLYLSFYNEIFINAQRNIGNGASVEIFDRNRLYYALGYYVKKGVKVQVGMMKQSTNAWTKEQLQLSFHHSF